MCFDTTQQITQCKARIVRIWANKMRSCGHDCAMCKCISVTYSSLQQHDPSFFYHCSDHTVKFIQKVGLMQLQ